MAIEERSLGPLYFARVATSQAICPVRMVGVVETALPWRRGKALMLPWWSRHWWAPQAIVLGLWFRDRHAVKDDDTQWFSPKYIRVAPSEISQWDNGLEEEEEPDITVIELQHTE